MDADCVDATGSLRRTEFGISMTDLSENKVERWLDAATLSGEFSAPRASVIRAAEFLEKTLQLSEEDACQWLARIDYSRPLTVVRLPTSVYVQHTEQEFSLWYTDTGFSPDVVRLARGRQLRTLFIPHGNVPALKSTPRCEADRCGINQLFQSVAPEVKKKMGTPTPGAGIRYLVLDPVRMRASL